MHLDSSVVVHLGTERIRPNPTEERGEGKTGGEGQGKEHKIALRLSLGRTDNPWDEEER